MSKWIVERTPFPNTLKKLILLLAVLVTILNGLILTPSWNGEVAFRMLVLDAIMAFGIYIAATYKFHSITSE